MADTKISGLTALTGANTASGDLLTIVDVSDSTMAATGTNKKITLTELQSAPVSGGTANGVLYLNGSKVATAGSALTFDGTNLGIGTTSPGAKIEVANGGIAIANGQQLLWRTSGGSLAQILKLNSSNQVEFGDSQTSSQAMMLAFGNLGLGVTPSAWRSGAKAFQLGATGYASLNEQANGSTSLNFNCYESAANTWTYFVTGFAPTRYTQLSGAHAWYNAPSGTAGNAITFTQAMTLDASGNLGVGTTTPDVFGRGYGRVIGVSSASSASVEVNAATGNAAFVDLGVNGVRYLQVYADSSAPGLFTVGSIPLAFGTNGTERARIDSSGNLLVGTTSAAYGTGERVSISGASTKNGIGIAVSGAGAKGIGIYNGNSTGATNGTMLEFQNSSSGVVGSITSNGTTTAYNVTSDQRLKENIADADSASVLIDSLQVRKYDWKSDGSHQRYGFVAQELVTVTPEAVYQPVDPEEMMAVDYSKLVPMLVKEIQSLRKRLADAGIA